MKINVNVLMKKFLSEKQETCFKILFSGVQFCMINTIQSLNIGKINRTYPIPRDKRPPSIFLLLNKEK